MTKDIKSAVPELQCAWNKIKSKCSKIGIDVRLSCVSRSQGEQCVLYLRGRYSLALVEQIYFKVFNVTLTEKTNVIVTNTIYSKHVLTKTHPLSRALDFYVYHDGIATWDIKADFNNDKNKDYLQVINMFETEGLKSGKGWGDYCHIEVI